MANPEITNLDCGTVQQGDCEHGDEVVNFTAGATYVEGTLLARIVAGAITAGAVQGGTGTGTVTVLSLPHSTVVPKVGVWRLEITEAVANGGVFRLVDPNGMIVATDIRMTVGSTVATVVEVAGMLFTITDATDFIAGNYFEITVAAGSGKLVPYSATGAAGAQNPVAVLEQELVRADAGDLAARPILKGRVAKERLVIHGGGTVSKELQDRLRAIGITPVSVAQLGRIDNPQA